MATSRWLSGRLLVSIPWLADPNFFRAVVLLLDHSDDGALGVVLNRPLTVGVGEVLPGWETYVSAPAGLFQGGPVGLDGALGVATLRPGAGPSPGVDPLTGPFGLVDLDGDPETVTAAITGLRVFAGHSGWGGGQLEEEIAAGGWYVLPSAVEDLLTDDPATLWHRVLRRQGGKLAVVANFPADPLLN